MAAVELTSRSAAEALESGYYEIYITSPRVSDTLEFCQLPLREFCRGPGTTSFAEFCQQ